ncbi:hypothetical protein BDD12DRAFT_807562 [Trichophaea hybrida]|nr:hypothetical protein BDD12DRAFT_807562 [Trichophaea hybrida]
MTASAQRSSANGASSTPSTDEQLSSPVPQHTSTKSQESGTDKTSQSFMGCMIPISAASKSVAKPFNAVGNSPLVEDRNVDEYDFNSRVLSATANSLCSVFPSFVCTYGVQLVLVHDPIFDNPGVCEMFEDVTPSNGPYWHKRTARIVEGMAEINPAVTEVLSRAVAAGFF